MTRLDHRSGPSRGIVFSLLAAGLTLLVASPASAKKKSPPAASSSDSAAGTDNEVPKAAGDDEKPSAQANDEEKPKPALNTEQEAPKTDSLGHVHFASPNGEGLGRVVVNAPVAEKVKVFLEGRLFGTAPVTIYSVPKGDYIVEAAYPNGKQVSKPVTVSENEETTVDLGGAKAAASGGGDSGSVFSTGEMTPFRKNLMYGFLIGAAVGIAVGTTFGILDLQAENDYQHTPMADQPTLDAISKRGQRDANIADVGWVVGAASLFAAGVCAIPLIFGGGSEKAAAAPSGTPSAFMFTPVAGPRLTGGALTMRF